MKPKPSKRSVRNITAPDEELADWRALAELDGLSIGAWMEWAIDEYTTSRQAPSNG